MASATDKPVPAYRLYEFPGSGNCYKVQLLLTLLDRPFERIGVDMLHGGTRTDAFLAKNPNGKVPVLEIEPGEYLPESNAALWYLAEGSDYLPSDPLQRARVLQWMFFEQYSHEPNIATVRFWVKYLGRPDSYAGRIARRTEAGYAALSVMEGHLRERRFFVADRYTIADIALYAYTHVADEGGYDLAPYPAVRAWLARVTGQPGHVPMAD